MTPINQFVTYFFTINFGLKTYFFRFSKDYLVAVHLKILPLLPFE